MSGSDQTDAPPDVSRQDLTSLVWSDGVLSPRNRKVEGSNPSSGSTFSQLSRPVRWLSCLLCLPS
jgi:hypothetical protein